MDRPAGGEESPWHGVPDEQEQEWVTGFWQNLLRPEERLRPRLTAPCPLCGRAQLFEWFVFPSEPGHSSLSDPGLWTGGAYQWCESCHACARYTVSIPEEWGQQLASVQRASAAEIEPRLDAAWEGALATWRRRNAAQEATGDVPRDGR
jgi:hypothetical protein